MNKKHVFILIILHSFFLSNGQNDLQFLKMKNPDSTIDISVINHGIKTYQIAVKLDLVQMTTKESFPLEFEVGPKEKRPITKIYKIPGQMGNYVIAYKITDISPNATDFTYEPNITIYTKNRHKRSTQLSIYLSQKGIAYNEVNTSYNGDMKAIYKSMLKRRGIDPKDAVLPVIIYKGEVFYDIGNIKKFCKEKFSDEGHFVKKNERRF